MPRPRRTAALRANEAITDMADSDRPMSRDRRSRGGPASVSRDPPSSPPDEHLNLNIKVSSNKLRQATVGRDGVRTEQQISVSNGRDSGRAVAGRRSRGGRKNYVVESDSDEDDDEDLDLNDDDEEDDDEDVDAEGEEDADGEVDEMELDAEGEVDDDPGEEDADGDIDMDAENSTITVSKPKGGSRARQATANAGQRALYEEDDDDELSEPGPSDVEDTITYGAGAGDEDAEGEEDAEGDEDAEGEEIEVAGEEDEEDGEGEEEEEELDSDGEPINGEAPDLSKMTRRQRARFEDQPQDYMKLSDGTLDPKSLEILPPLSALADDMLQRCKQRRFSQPRNSRCAVQRWRGGGGI